MIINLVKINKSLMNSPINSLKWVICIIFGAMSRQLIFTQVTSRHGVRYPGYELASDYSNITKIQNADGQLTVEGKAMHFYLGKEIYRKYWKALFAGTPDQNAYHQTIIYVKSTNMNRTLQSAQSQLMGLFQFLSPADLGNISKKLLYPPFKDIQHHQAIDKLLYGPNGSSLHPVAIHSEKGGEGSTLGANPYDQGDFLLKSDSSNCPNQNQWEQENLRSDIVKEIVSNANVKEAMAQLSVQAKDNIDFNNAYQYVHNYISLKDMSRPYLPIFDNTAVFKYLNFLRIAHLYATDFLVDSQIRIQSTGLLEATISNINQAIKNNGPKMVLYFGHDSTIASFLTFMQYTSLRCITDYYLYDSNNADTCISVYPEFASNFIFELWKEDNGTYTITTLFNGEVVKIPICNQSISCNFEQFTEWFRTVKVDDPNSACGIAIDYSKYNIIVGVLSGLLVMVVLYVLFTVYFSRKMEMKKDEATSLIDDVQ